VSEKKQSTDANAGNPVLEALVELLQKIDESGERTPKSVREAAQNLKDELPALSGDAMQKRTLGEALDLGLNPKRKQTGRHDQKRPPAGHQFEQGYLIAKTEPRTLAEQTTRDEQILKHVVGNTKIWTLEAKGGLLGQYREKLEGVFQAIYGYRYGEGWRTHLANLLEQDRRNREESRLQQASGGPKQGPLHDFRRELEIIGGPELFRPMSGEWIRERLVAIGFPAPALFTAEVIEGMRALVGGRGGKTAMKVVEETEASLRKKSSE